MKANLVNEDFSNVFDALDKVVIKVGKIIEVERIPKNKKMIRMVVNFDSDGNKTVISNIGGNMEDVSVLVGNCFPFITNLDPTERNGHMSEAMIVADINDNIFNHETGRKCS